MGEQQQPVQAAAIIQIILTPDGRVLSEVQGQGITFVAILGMLEVAKAKIVAKQQEADRRPKIITHADPALAAQMSKG